MHSQEHRHLMSTIQEYIDKGYDSLTDLHTCRPSELVNILSKRGTFSHLRPDVHRWFELTTEAVSVVTSDLEFIGYLKGRMLEAQLEWENNDTSETVSKFLYFYNYLIDVISTKLLDEKYLFGRERGSWASFDGFLINLDEVESFKYDILIEEE